MPSPLTSPTRRPPSLYTVPLGDRDVLAAGHRADPASQPVPVGQGQHAVPLAAGAVVPVALVEHQRCPSLPSPFTSAAQSAVT